MLKLFVALQNRVAELRDREEGQAYVEYGVLIAVVAIAMIAVFIAFRTQLTTAFNNLAGALLDQV
jgi:Flp pilus assembly pilin Flp